ncbi:MAG: hypothetical protein Q9226_005756 [Calogaya cf. arnoldii]
MALGPCTTLESLHPALGPPPRVNSPALGLFEPSHSILRPKRLLQGHHVILRSSVLATTHATRLMGPASTSVSFGYAFVLDVEG